MSITVNGVLSNIKDDLGITDTGQDTKIIRHIHRVFLNMKFAFIQSRQGYYLTYTGLDVAAGEDEIDLPSGLLQVKALYYTKSPDDASIRWKRLELSPSMSIASREHDQSDDFSYYIVEGDKIRLEYRPLTTVTGGLRLFASLSLTTPLAAGASIGISDDFAACLEYGVLSRYHLNRRDYTAHEYNERLYEAEKHSIKRILHHRIEHIEEEIGFHPREL